MVKISHFWSKITVGNVVFISAMPMRQDKKSESLFNLNISDTGNSVPPQPAPRVSAPRASNKKDRNSLDGYAASQSGMRSLNSRATFNVMEASNTMVTPRGATTDFNQLNNKSKYSSIAQFQTDESSGKAKKGTSFGRKVIDKTKNFFKDFSINPSSPLKIQRNLKKDEQDGSNIPVAHANYVNNQKDCGAKSSEENIDSNLLRKRSNSNLHTDESRFGMYADDEDVYIMADTQVANKTLPQSGNVENKIVKPVDVINKGRIYDTPRKISIPVVSTSSEAFSEKAPTPIYSRGTQIYNQETTNDGIIPTNQIVNQHNSQNKDSFKIRDSQNNGAPVQNTNVESPTPQNPQNAISVYRDNEKSSPQILSKAENNKVSGNEKTSVPSSEKKASIASASILFLVAIGLIIAGILVKVAFIITIALLVTAGICTLSSIIVASRLAYRMNKKEKDQCSAQTLHTTAGEVMHSDLGPKTKIVFSTLPDLKVFAIGLNPNEDLKWALVNDDTTKSGSLVAIIKHIQNHETCVSVHQKNNLGGAKVSTVSIQSFLEGHGILENVNASLTKSLAEKARELSQSFANTDPNSLSLYFFGDVDNINGIEISNKEIIPNQSLEKAALNQNFEKCVAVN